MVQEVEWHMDMIELGVIVVQKVTVVQGVIMVQGVIVVQWITVVQEVIVGYSDTGGTGVLYNGVSWYGGLVVKEVEWHMDIMVQGV